MKKQIKQLLVKFPRVYNLLKPNHLGTRGLDNEELNYILNLIGKDKLCLEIGTFTGFTTKELAKDNHVVGIDPFIPNDEFGTLYGVYSKDVYNMFMKNTLGMNVVLFPTTSKKAFEFWDNFIDRKFDFILVDGEHTYKALINDIKWIRHLKIGGIIAFDDTELPEIEKFFREKSYKLKELELIKGFPHMKIYRRIV